MKYIVKRVIFFLITAWAAVTINFILPRLMPGNPAEVMIAKFQGRLNPQAINALEIASLSSLDGSRLVERIHHHLTLRD